MNSTQTVEEESSTAPTSSKASTITLASSLTSSPSSLTMSTVGKEIQDEKATSSSSPKKSNNTSPIISSSSPNNNNLFITKKFESHHATEQKITQPETFDDMMIRLLTHKNVIVIVFSCIYVCSLLYTYSWLGWKGCLLNLFLTLVQMYLNKNNIKSTMLLDYAKADNSEKPRLIISLAILTVRYFIFPKNKITFIPPTFMWFIGANKMYDEHNNFWALLPLYYLTCLYGGVGMTITMRELITNGFGDAFVDSLCETVSLTCCLWVFTYYRVNVTGFLKQKVEILEETSMRLESALDSKNTFMAHISHEFRCPLLSSLGSLELLKETYLSIKQNELVDMIISSNNVLLMLIEEILQLMKIEFDSRQKNAAELLKSNFKKFSIGDCLKSLQNIVTGYSNHFAVGLKFDFDEVKNIHVESNPSSLHQIVSNLLTNAVKASKREDVVELKARIIENYQDEVQGSMARLEFKVTDYGYGIPESKLDAIFEPFVQLHNVNESHVPSSGLGLTTVLHFIQQMDGTIKVESQIGKGSTFTVTLPLKVVNVSADEYSDWENSGAKMSFAVQQRYLSLISNVHELSDDNTSDTSSIITESKHNKIIIAEDNVINRKVIFKLLESIGHSADIVTDGKELVDHFNILHHKLVITDLNMPNMNGVQAAQELKKRHGNAVKIVLLTGNSAIKVESLKGIVDGLIQKPCSKEDLRKCINLYCED